VSKLSYTALAWVALTGCFMVPENAEAQPAPIEDSASSPKMSGRNARREELEEESFERQANAAVERYLAVKRQIRNDFGLWYTMATSAMSQWGVPGGGYGAVQAEFTPAVDWHAFYDPAWGVGSFQFSFLSTQYWSGATGVSLASALDVTGPINDKPFATNIFAQLTYTHELPGRQAAITLGQYSFANFDSNRYADDQQLSFIANGMTGNISQTYSEGALGAYLHLYPTKRLVLAAGFQDANNPSGSYIQFDTFSQGAYAWFLYGAYNPRISEHSKGHYSLLYYNVPSVPAQREPSVGFSFNAAQSLGERLGLFLRANTASGNAIPVSSSVSGGAVIGNPVGRDPLDRIGIALAWNQTNTAFFGGTFVRPSETMIELYWAWDLFGRVQLTPDIQIYLQPARAPTEYAAAVFTLRITTLF
jgi:hypothetical protein